MRSIKQKIALAAGLGLLFTAAALVAYGIYATNNTKNFVSTQVSQLLEKTSIAALESLASDRATVVETAGAFSAIVVAIPLFTAVWELLRGML